MLRGDFRGCNIDARRHQISIALKSKLDTAAERREPDQIAKLGRASDRFAVEGLDDIALRPAPARRRTK